MSTYKVISADSHSNEPESLYDRLPAEYRARAPHEETIDGKRYLVYEGRPPSPIDAPNPLNEDDIICLETLGDFLRSFWEEHGLLANLELLCSL